MNKLINYLVAAIFLVLLPMKSFAQLTRVTNNESTISFDITNIANFDERVFFLYNLITDGRFDVITSEQDGVYVISESEAFEGINLRAVFNDFRTQNADDFTRMTKEQAAEVAAEFKGLLPNEFISSLMMDYYLRSRQNNTCANADPFCTDNGMYQFPAGVNAGSGESGPYYDCLYTQPNPAWYYMRIANPGSIIINMYSTPSVDIDFCCWGPFPTITNPSPCSSLTSDKVVSCSYSTASNENCIIPSSAQTGDYFILIITNYSNQTCNINFSKTGGTGTTDCGILPPMVDNDGPYCVGETIHLTANGQAGASYSWTGPGGFSSNQQNPTRTNCTMAMAGTYTCTITVGTQTNSATTDVVVYPQPNANFTFTSVCQGQPTQFTSTSTTNPSGQQITGYLWNFGGGQTSTQQNPSYTFPNAGNHQVTLTVSCGNGHCTSTKTQTVTVYPQPAANAGDDQTIPYGTSTQLSGSGGAGTFNYHWDPANMVTNPNAQNTQTVTLTQDQTYTLTVTNPQGDCSSTDQVTIYISGSAMTVTAGPDISICQGGSGQIYVSAGGGTGNLTYSWTPTTGLSNPNISNPMASPSQTTTYTCHVTDGQTSQNVSVTVTVNEVIVEDEYMTICPGDVYNWHGGSYYDAGTWHIDTVTDQGCDKTIYLHLDHYPTYDETTITEAICYGESYTFYDTTYSAPGFHQISYTDHTIHGCDSIVRLELTVWPENVMETLPPVSRCPDNLPYVFEGDSIYEPGTYTFILQDSHGCDKPVQFDFSVTPYSTINRTEYVGYYSDSVFHCYIPEIDTVIPYYSGGTHIDTLPTAPCESIFTLNLTFCQIPETTHITDSACNSYDWWVKGVWVGNYDHNCEVPYSIPLYSDPNNPSTQVMYYDPNNPSAPPTPCTEDYKLHLTVNHKNLNGERSYNGDLEGTPCDSIQFQWFGNTTYFKENGDYLFSSEPNPNAFFVDLDAHTQTEPGCDTATMVKVTNMKYTPLPDKYGPSDGTTSWFGIPEEEPNDPTNDTAMCAAVVTNTEFFSFQYQFYVEDAGKSVWDTCIWDISKTSWHLTPVFCSDKKSSTCWVNVADRDEDYVVLTATAKNSCGEKTKKFYLKSSFLGVDENGLVPVNVDIVPNPNNGQMRLNFENMHGRTAVKVFDMTGNQIDAFETTINSNRYNYDYNLKKHANGIYFFVISNNSRVLTKKVVVIH